MAMTTPVLMLKDRRCRGIAVTQGRFYASVRFFGLTVARATIVIVLLGLLWRTVRYALAFPLWGDEAFVAVTLLERDIAGLSRPPEFYQIVPPAFLWSEWLAVRWLGSGEWALRLIPFLAGVASLLLFWRFCRGATTRRTTLLAVAILAASFYPVRHAAEVKPYATDLLVSLVLTSLAWATYRRIVSLPRWSALIAAAVVGVWCSYPAIFPAGAVAMLLGTRAIRERSGRARVLWAAYCTLLATSWGLMYDRYAGPQARAAAFLTELKTWRDAFPPAAQPWRLPWWFIRVHTGMMLAYPQGGHNFGSAPTALLTIVGCIRMARRRARRPLLLLLLGPLPLALAAASLHRYPYGTSTRVMLYMAPAFCLLAAEGLIAALRLRHCSGRGPIVVAGLLAIFPIGGVAHDLIWPYVGFDNMVHRRLARLVASFTAPGDEYVVFNGVTPPPPLPDLMITRWLQRVAVVRYYLRNGLPAPIRWEPDPATVRPGPGGRLWLLIQRHGDERFFSEECLAAYQSALEARLGAPQFFDHFDLPNGESWTLWAYPVPIRSGSHRPGTPRNEQFSR
jgi:hypothetical protein